MSVAPAGVDIEFGAAVPTWFGVGGRADRLARPADAEALRRCLEIEPRPLVLGDGANLLVHDDGVGHLVVSLQQGEYVRVEFAEDEPGLVRVGAGFALPRLVTETVRRGLGGLEGLGGVPATLGGAVVMNAGGRFGEIGEAVERVHALGPGAEPQTLERGSLGFGYRRSALAGLVVTSIELRLTPGDRGELRERLKACMASKKRSQPMAARSAGCVFKNPRLGRDVEGIGASGERVSAGMLLDRAGCKGMRVGGASVSARHANFVVVEAGASAGDVLALTEQVAERVGERFGVGLEREVVVWGRDT